MTESEYAAAGLALSKEAGVLDSLHRYFHDGLPRLYRSCQVFGLFEQRLGDVLEVGPFYGYTPFVLQSQAASYVIMEGDDPAAYPLKALYQKRGISTHFVDLFEEFGPTHSAKRVLPFGDDTFDSILCWETMEHFNFNPVPFVRELYRVAKPGGRIYITVPNKASFQKLVALLTGRQEVEEVGSYYRFENYQCNGKRAFYGFHWREYSPPELRELFSKAGFAIRKCDTFVAFQSLGDLSAKRRLARGCSTVLAAVFHRYGTNTCLIAEKPAAPKG